MKCTRHNSSLYFGGQCGQLTNKQKWENVNTQFLFVNSNAYLSLEYISFYN